MWQFFFILNFFSLCVFHYGHIYTLSLLLLSLFVYIWNERLLWDSFLWFIKTIFVSVVAVEQFFFILSLRMWSRFYFLLCLCRIRLRSFLSSFEFFAISRIIKTARTLNALNSIRRLFQSFSVLKIHFPILLCPSTHSPPTKIHMWMALFRSHLYSFIRVCHHVFWHTYTILVFVLCLGVRWLFGIWKCATLWNQLKWKM